MCGLSCVINNDIPDNKVRDFMEQALFVNTLRGNDSAGLFSINKEGGSLYFKKPFAGPDLLELPGAELVLNFDNPRFMVGHNRASTRGSAHSVHHAHPISHEHIILVQNGTLTTTYGLVESGGGGFVHDTTAIAEAMVKRGEKATLELLEGSYALIWYNFKTNSLNFARNTERPLWLGQIKGDKGWLIASEDGMISWLAQRNSIDLKGISMLKEGLWMSVPLDPKKTPVREKFKIYQPRVYNPNNNFACNTERFTPYYGKAKIGEIIKAEFEGKVVIEQANPKIEYYKFKRQGDTAFAWVVDHDPKNKLLTNLKAGVTYRLKVIEPRLHDTTSANLKADLLGIDIVSDTSASWNQVYSYKSGDSIRFMKVDNKGDYVEGITCDVHEVEIRIYSKGTSLSKDKVYTAEVRTPVVSNGSGYLILDDRTIKAATVDVENLCAWCQKPLTAREVRDNISEDAGSSNRLCDECVTYSIAYKN
jgi:hypothetical protein